MTQEALAQSRKIDPSRLRGHLALGVRWLTCGGRLFRRHPWALGGMGFFGSVLITVLTLVPLVGRPVVALLAPIFLASAYLAIEAMMRQKIQLPLSLRLTVFKQSPRELLSVFRNEERVIPMLLVGLYSLTIALVVDALALLINGSAWGKPWASLDVIPLLTVLATALFVLAIYFLLAASLIYTLPLVFLRDQPLIPAAARSFRAGVHYVVALSVILAPLLASGIIGAIVSNAAVWAGHIAQLVINAIVLPLVTASLYCSYRTVFPPPAPAR